MSFQGDVAGLGLGELLQGLARGGREGVLTLRGGNLSARLGVCDGQVQLLPELGEDPEQWRKRCERAWVKDPDQRIDTLRMSEIALAARMEGMFDLLDCEGVHFRFEPGPIVVDPGGMGAQEAPEQLARVETGTTLERMAPITCAPISVEYLLLEYARLTDELGGQPGAAQIPETLVPRALSADSPDKAYLRLWQECDGMSTLREIADRLGWPIRQVRASIAALFHAGELRAADARELLALAQKELSHNRLARAASRIAGWCDFAPPGAPTHGDAEMLLAEWEKGKLSAALASMEAAHVRTFLRRIDHAHQDPSSAVARWREARKHHKHDPVCELRTLHWQHLSDNDADAPGMSDLLRVARKFQETGHPWRSAIVLRTAAARGPETTAVRLEIGQRLVAVGDFEDGAAWVVEACRGMLLANMPDKAIGPLRQLLDVAPTHREAKALLNLAHGKTVTGKRTRRNSLVVLSVVLALSTAAVVKVRSDSDYEGRLAQVRELHSQPERALELVNELFGDSQAAEVAALRSDLRTRIEGRRADERSTWLDAFQQCQIECSSGDPVLGLRTALTLPPPPAHRAGEDAPPTITVLLEGLSAGLEQTLDGWEDPTVDSTEAMHSEARLARLVADLQLVVADAEHTEAIKTFAERLAALSETLARRSELRAQAREKRSKDLALELQEELLLSAREHAKAGDLERSVETFEKLAQTPESEQIVEILADEIRAVRRHRDAAREAWELAEHGQHAEALELLSSVCKNPSEHLLPSRIDSWPRGARARFVDGSSRVTPFVLESAPGSPVALTFEYDGFDSTEIAIESPADRTVLLSREAERAWPSSASVIAAPVAVDDEHIVCDRAGRIARIGKEPTSGWSRSLESISGVARTPVFLPKRPGSLLVVTEDGAVWVVDAAAGKLEGPLDVHSAPISGPEATPHGARVRFHDGRELVWNAHLTPESESALAAGETYAPDRGHDAGLALLRRNPQTNVLAPPWSDWSVEVGATDFIVRRSNASEPEFGVRRVGEWNYVAWEAPRARMPRGRLWISDGFGLRAFTP